MYMYIHMYIDTYRYPSPEPFKWAETDGATFSETRSHLNPYNRIEGTFGVPLLQETRNIYVYTHMYIYIYAYNVYTPDSSIPLIVGKAAEKPLEWLVCTSEVQR